MHVAEIAAEKLRALSMRQAPRDVYDLWVIAGHKLAEVSQVAQLVPRKLGVVGIDLDQAGIDRHLAAVEAIWTTDLAGLMADIPPYSEVRQVLDPWLQDLLDAVAS
jgi:predicted nucleotidyltransferase component of viral defense system